MKYALVLLAFFLASVASADQRETKIRQLMEAQRLLETFQQQLELGRRHSHEQGRMILKQMISGLNPTAEYSQRFEEAFDVFESDLEEPWGTDDIVDVWAKYYGAKFSDEELDQLLDYYSSPLGQKEVIATRQAFIEFFGHFAELGKPITQKAVAHFVGNLRLIARECDCRRRQAATLQFTAP